MFSTLFAIYNFFLIASSICFGQGQQNQLSKTPEVIKFMMNYGYLADLGPNTEALYSKKGIKEAIKSMQVFGGLVPTGKLDDATLALLEKPRCGLPDTEPKRNIPGNLRSKRYAIVSSGWKNSQISYRLNDYPNRMLTSVVRKQFRDAFDVWSAISPLRFREVNSRQVDMDILFRDGKHGDQYPFDGPGNILAHAFFPHSSLNRGGDIHFDRGEKWADLSTNDEQLTTDIDSVDLFTVAAHEIGHALGLGHSNDTEALMFPYYKGFTEKSAIIGEDDKLAMTKLYGSLNDRAKRPSARKPVRRTTEVIRPRRPSTHAPHHTTRRTRRPTHEPRYTTQRQRTRPTTHVPRVTRRPTTRTGMFNGAMELPNLCEGSFDAMSVIRGELMIFKKNFMWRYKNKGRLEPGYPVEFRRFFRKFPVKIRKIDAIYERVTDGNIVFFTGPEYWVSDGVNFIENSPQPLTTLGLPNYIMKIDAALMKSKEKVTYLFHRNEYFRYNETSRTICSRYPQRIRRNYGFQTSIDNALEWKNGKSYLFKDKHYWILEDNGMRAIKQVANLAPREWAGCRE